MERLNKTATGWTVTWIRCGTISSKPDWARFLKCSTAIRRIIPEAASRKRGAWPKCCALISKMQKIFNPPRLSDLKRELAALADPERARNSAWFFKTARGQYGEGDRFIGITVPALRRIARRYRNLPLAEIAKLLASRTHEHRFPALEILVTQYESGDAGSKQSIFDFYLLNARNVNNWDLVDTSAPYIIGEHLRSRPRDTLYKLAKSRNVWERRMAMVATMPFIRAGDLDDTFAIAAL